MKNYLSPVLGVWLALASAGTFSYADDATEQRLTRSVYVPVHFSIDQQLIDHLRIWMIQVDGEDITLSTHPHTFIFTYFPVEEGYQLRPKHVEVRLQAKEACIGKDLDTNFFITPFGIVSSQDQVAFDPEKFETYLRSGRRNLRLPRTLIRIQCPAAKEPLASMPQNVDFQVKDEG